MPKLSAFRMVESSLFHSIIADGKKAFLKKLRLILTSGKPSTFLIEKDFCFHKLCKKLPAFYTTVVIEVTLSLALGKYVLLEVPLITPVSAKHALY